MRHVIDLGRRSPDCAADRHGTISAYRYGCRCPHAREQDRIYNKRRSHGRAVPAYIDRTGTMRRLQALRVQGWRSQDIAARMDVSYQFITDLCLPTGQMVARTTAAKVEAITRELADREGPSLLSATRSRARGWVSLAEWDDIDDPAARPVAARLEADATPDDVAVEMVLTKTARFSALTSDVDRREVVRVLAGRGMDARAIANHVSSSEPVVTKVLKALTEDTTGRAAA
jgi:hypothetical protein